MITRHVLVLSVLAVITPPIAVAQPIDHTRAAVSELLARIDELPASDQQKLRNALNSRLNGRKTKSAKRAPAEAAVITKAPALSAAGTKTVVPTEIAKCADQSFFLRKDRTDIFSFLVPCGPSDVPGASASYTDNISASTKNLTVQALAGYTVLRGENPEGTFLYSLTPSVSFSGIRAEPFNPKTERNAVRAAIDPEFLVSTPEFIFRTHTVDIAPYYQTDYRGKASISGIDAVWEPYNLDILLGGRYDEQARRPVGFYWRLQAEADINRVETAGRTNFVSGTSHEFLGGTLQARMIFLQNMPEVGEALCGRIYASATAQRFTDAAAGQGVSNYSAEVGYYLGSGVAPYWRFCVPRVNGEAPLPSAGATSSSISFVYNEGTDKTTMVNQHQYKVQLNYRY